jgi:putative redox protein
MKATVEWNGGGLFTGLSNSGIPIRMASHIDQGEPNTGASPMELIALGLAGCMAMDVMSIMEKKRQVVTSCLLNVDAPRSSEYPRVFTSALITFVLTGRSIDETAVRRCIELSATKYCPAHAMLAKSFPITLGYEIYEEPESGERQLIHQGIWQQVMQ